MRCTAILFLIGTLFVGSTDGQIIRTIAGNGTLGFSGDNGLAIDAEVSNVGGICFDNLGNLYVADCSNNRVRKISVSGIITTIAGNGSGLYFDDGHPATNSPINRPTDIAVDANGNMYIADQLNNRIRKVDNVGLMHTIAGNGTGGHNGDTIAATAASVYSPTGVAVDNMGNVYIADNLNNRVRMVNTSGIITTIAGNGNIGNTGDGGAATAAEINHPHSVRLDKMGYIYVSCASKIRKISPMGIISTVAGTDSFGYNGDNIAATNALLDIPVGIAIDDTGNLFIAENAGHRIRKVTTLGIITTIAGNGIGGYNGDGISATAAEIYYPGGVAVDTYDNIYISDGGNGRIRSIRAFVSVPTITNSANGLIAYPNPFTDQTTILYGNKDGEVYDFILYNAQGQVVRSERDNKGGSITISKGNMAEGVYYYRLSNKNGVVYTGKLVVM